ncbi:MAG TPA: hypothetical protein V6C58_24395 [Allocoleopsis sp.]
MKPIQPVTIWTGGLQKTANEFNLRIIADDLSSSATFYYELLDKQVTLGATPEDEPTVSTTVLANGNSALEGAEYEAWGDSTDINEDAYVRIAAKLNLTLV